MRNEGEKLQDQNTRLNQIFLSSAVKSVHVRETEERHCSSDLAEPRRDSLLSLPIPWKYLTFSIGGALPTAFRESMIHYFSFLMFQMPDSITWLHAREPENCGSL